MSTSEQEDRGSVKSDWSVIGLAHKFLLAWERVEGTKADLNRLAESSGLLRQFVLVLRGRFVIGPRQFPTWKVARRGVHRSFDAYRASMDRGGSCVFGVYQDSILSQIPWAQEEIADELVLLSDTELGLPDRYDYAALVTAALDVGLYPCDPEVAADLAEKSVNHPAGFEWGKLPRYDDDHWSGVIIAMPSVAACGYNDSLLTLGERGHLGTISSRHRGYRRGQWWVLSRRNPATAQD